MKTEEEIKESIRWLQKRIDQSLDASELGEDITGVGTELSDNVLSIYTAKKETLAWVLE